MAKQRDRVIAAPEKFENLKIDGFFGFVFEENSNKRK